MSEVTGRHTLHRPIKIVVKGVDGERTEEMTEVIMRPIESAKDLRVLDKYDGKVAQTLGMIAYLSDLTLAQVDCLHPKDFAALQERIENFT